MMITDRRIRKLLEHNQRRKWSFTRRIHAETKVRRKMAKRSRRINRH